MGKTHWLWTWRVLRWVLALIFAAAALLKLFDPANLEIADPTRFVGDIRNYRLVPWWSLHALAILLPWIELVCAGALVIGRWTEEATVVLMSFMVVYMVGISAAMARGFDIHCGCFGSYDTAPMVVVLIRDVVFMGIAAGIIIANRRRLAAGRPAAESA